MFNFSHLYYKIKKNYISEITSACKIIGQISELHDYPSFDVKNLFQQIDTLNLGYINYDALSVFLETNDINLSDDEIFIIIRKVSGEHNGLITFN